MRVSMIAQTVWGHYITAAFWMAAEEINWLVVLCYKMALLSFHKENEKKPNDALSLVR